MNASKTPGTADHLNTITELLDTLRSASELVAWAARRLQDCNQHVPAGRLFRAQTYYDRLIVKTIGVYGDAAPAVGRGCIPDTEAVRDAAPDLLEALQAVSLTVAIHAGQHPGDREAQQDLAKVRAALRKATTVRETAPTTSLTNDPAHGGPGGGMGDAAAALPVCGCTIGNELHSRPLTRGEAAVGKTLDVTA